MRFLIFILAKGGDGVVHISVDLVVSTVFYVEGKHSPSV